MEYFVSENWLKENTSVTDGVDIKSVVPLIKSSADMWTRSTLGTYFYKYLLTQFNTQTLNADEIYLVENYIKPAIAWRATADAVIELTWQLKNKGLQSQSGDFSQSADFRTTTFVRDYKDGKAVFYENLLFEYLKENKELFPQLTDKQNKDSQVVKRCFGNDSFNQSIFVI